MNDIEIDHECTDNAVCPYCGHVDKDSWELPENDSETQCGSCGKEYFYERSVFVSYSTHKIESEVNND